MKHNMQSPIQLVARAAVSKCSTSDHTIAALPSTVEKQIAMSDSDKFQNFLATEEKNQFLGYVNRECGGLTRRDRR